MDKTPRKPLSSGHVHAGPLCLLLPCPVSPPSTPPPSRPWGSAAVGHQSPAGRWQWGPTHVQHGNWMGQVGPGPRGTRWRRTGPTPKQIAWGAPEPQTKATRQGLKQRRPRSAGRGPVNLQAAACPGLAPKPGFPEDKLLQVGWQELQDTSDTGSPWCPRSWCRDRL